MSFNTEETIYHSFSVGHECEKLCSNCNGSGEGRADGTTCYVCKGWGTVVHNGYVKEELWIEYKKEDPTAWRLLFESVCSECGFDYEQAAEEYMENFLEDT